MICLFNEIINKRTITYAWSNSYFVSIIWFCNSISMSIDLILNPIFVFFRPKYLAGVMILYRNYLTIPAHTESKKANKLNFFLGKKYLYFSMSPLTAEYVIRVV